MNHKTKTALRFGVSALIVLLAGCSGSSEPMTVTVYYKAKDQTSMGCICTDWSTYVQADDHRSFKLCGDWGPVGTKLRGRYVTGYGEGPRFYPG